MTRKDIPDDNNIFIRNSIYPEAEGIFSFRPKTLQSIKEEALIVLDTNTLLVPYTTGKDSLEQIKKIYTELVQEQRLIVPGQVAREFAENRETKLKELYQQILRKRLNPPNLGKYPLLEKIEEYTKARNLESPLKNSIDEYNRSIDAILTIVREWYWDDPVSLLYSDLFSGNVVLDPDFNNEQIKERLQKDIDYKLPPGYKDAGKPDQGIGDLLIWSTILEAAKTHKKSVIFISLDQKTDWMSRSEGRPLYPRYELIDEFRRISQGNSIHIIQFSSFLGLYGATADVVKEVHQEELQAIIENTEPDYKAIHSSISVEKQVFRWLSRQYPDRVGFAPLDAGVDFQVVNSDGRFIGVEVKYLLNPNRSGSRLGNVIKQMENAYKTGQYSEMLLVLVSKERIPPLMEHRFFSGETPIQNLSVILGYIGDDGEFKEFPQ